MQRKHSPYAQMKRPEKVSHVSHSISHQMRNTKIADVRRRAQEQGVSPKGTKTQVLRRLFHKNSHASEKGGFAAFRMQSANARRSGAKSFIYSGNGQRYTRGKSPKGGLIVYRASPRHRAAQAERRRSASHAFFTRHKQE
jgi:hypothetical protein